MKKLALVVLFFVIGLAGYSQNLSSLQRLIIGIWSYDAGDEVYEFDITGKMTYQTFIRTHPDSASTERHWQAFIGIYSIEGHNVKIQFAAEENEFDLELHGIETEKELEIVILNNLTILFDGRHHYTKRH
ncbi:MAG: hypothetical protein LBH42_04030 [Treponema sp.]|jgi:hypothetical protein|nr:hypothetical protein [Treponema sp.]